MTTTRAQPGAARLEAVARDSPANAAVPFRALEAQEWTRSPAFGLFSKEHARAGE
jgi:hypothetical protein